MQHLNLTPEQIAELQRYATSMGLCLQQAYVQLRRGEITLSTPVATPQSRPAKPPVIATVTRCREKQPLIVLEGGPFNGLEIRPVELRRLAQNLAALAEMAVRMPTGGKRFSPTKIVIGEEA